MTATTSTSRKVLVPLATLLAAGAVAVGSGATWTSNSTSAVDVTAGSIIHTNSTTANGQTELTITKLQPGESASGTVKITNTGDLISDLTITQSGVTNGFSALGSDGVVGGTGNAADVSDLKLTVSQDGTQLYTGAFDGWTASNLNLGQLAASDPDTTDDETTLTFTVKLESWAANASQGGSAGATFAFETKVASGQTFDRVGWNLP